MPLELYLTIRARDGETASAEDRYEVRIDHRGQGCCCRLLRCERRRDVSVSVQVAEAERKIEAGKMQPPGFYSFRICKYLYVHLYSKLGTRHFVAMCRPTASMNQVSFSNSWNSTWELHTYPSSYTLRTHTHRPSCASHVPSVPGSSIPCTQSNCGPRSLA